jgi:hypothetical protein
MAVQYDAQQDDLSIWALTITGWQLMLAYLTQM